MQLYKTIIICPFATYGLAHGPKTCRIWYQGVQTLRDAYPWNRWTYFLRSKFVRIVLPYSCATVWSLGYFTHMDLPEYQNIYLGNCWMGFLGSKLYGIASICSCAAVIRPFGPYGLAHNCQFDPHDDVIKWKHFARYWPPTQRPVTRSFEVFFDLRLNHSWANNWDAGDLRRYRDHYDIIVMICLSISQNACLWNWWIDFLCSNFYGTSRAFAHLTLMGLPRVHISKTFWWIYSTRSSVEFSIPLSVCGCATSWSFAHLPHVCLPMSMSHKLVKFGTTPHFVEPIYMKPQDGFTPFELLWNCLGL